MSDNAELHDLERKRHEAIPNHIRDGEQVAVERPTGDDLLIAADASGDLVGDIADATKDRHQGRSRLTDLLVPFTVRTERRGAVKISHATTLYFEDIEGNIRLDEVRVDGEGRLYAEFREQTSAFPYRTWTFRTVDLARFLETERLRTQAEIDERARALLGLDDAEDAEECGKA